MTRCGIRVVKVGGSLLQDDHVAAKLKHWLDRHRDRHNVLLAGGGRLADWVRRADQRFGLGEEAAHWIAVSTLGVTAQLLSWLLSEAWLTTDWTEPRRHGDGGAPRRDWIIDPRDFLVHSEPQLPGRPLAPCWRVTSDSIAARLASVYPADELVLLKSCPAPAVSLADLAAVGYVDPDFPQAAGALPSVRFVDLRAEEGDA